MTASDHAPTAEAAHVGIQPSAPEVAPAAGCLFGIRIRIDQPAAEPWQGEGIEPVETAHVRWLPYATECRLRQFLESGHKWVEPVVIQDDAGVVLLYRLSSMVPAGVRRRLADRLGREFSGKVGAKTTIQTVRIPKGYRSEDGPPERTEKRVESPAVVVESFEWNGGAVVAIDDRVRQRPDGWHETEVSASAFRAAFDAMIPDFDGPTPNETSEPASQPPAATARVLSPEHRRQLLASGLEASAIDNPEYGFYTVTDPEEARRILSWDRPPGPGELLPALAIQYYDAAGEATNYIRLRPDHPRVGENGKPVKYESPRGRPSRAYIPPYTRTILKNARVQLLITEGEKKASAADQHEIGCVGLAGVWNFRQTATPSAPKDLLLDDLDKIEWRGRSVVIAFDSDIVTKPNVQQAQQTLASILAVRGAEVRALFLPSPAVGKLGIDDYLCLHGEARFKNLLFSGTGRVPEPEPNGVIRNFWTVGIPDDDGNVDTVDIPKSADAIVRNLTHYCGGWPKAVGNQLVVPDRDGRPRVLEKAQELIAFTRNRLEEQYAGPTARVVLRKDKVGQGFLSEGAILSSAPELVERFADVSKYPHEPPVMGVCYMPYVPAGGTGADLNKLLDMFSPETEVDASLIRAFWLTLLWGGPGGRRPMFLFTGPTDDPDRGCGVGKSTIPELAAHLLGGSIEVEKEGASATQIKTQMLSGDSAGLRLCRIDNLKTHRFSWGELESLITQDAIRGHKMWHGHSSRPNLFTYTVTLNGAALSEDIAQRVCPIRLRRPAHSPTWRPTVEKLLRDRGRHIIGDIAHTLRAACVPPSSSNYSRWGEWERGVLARVPGFKQCLEVIAARQMEFNADKESGATLREQFCLVLERLGFDPDAESVRITIPAICEIYRLATNENKSAKAVTGELKISGIAELRKADAKGHRYWGWVGAGRQPSRRQYDAVIDFDRRDFRSIRMDDPIPG